MKIATLTPSRDRKVLLDFCKLQLDHQTYGEFDRYYMAFDPETVRPDLTRRVRQGYELAKRDGVDWIIIVEDDDGYPSNYVDRFIPYLDKHDFIGDPVSLYYRIDTRRYQIIKHPGRASLYTTAFRVSALNKFKWPPDDKVFLDIDLWKYAKQNRLRMKFIDAGAVGIKGHGVGKTGGNGHKFSMKRDDSDLSFLRSKLEDHHMAFYHDLMKWK